MSETQQHPAEAMTWTEYLWTVKSGLLGVQAVIVAYVAFVYIGSLFFPNEPLGHFYMFAVFMELYAVLRIVGIKNGITSEDLYP